MIAGAVGTAVLFGTLSSGIPGLPAADAQVAKAASELPNGIGGRVYLNSTGAVFTAKIVLPETVKNNDSVSTPIFILALGQQAELKPISGFSTANNTTSGSPS